LSPRTPSSTNNFIKVGAYLERSDPAFAVVFANLMKYKTQDYKK